MGNSSFGGVLPDTYGLSAAMDAAAATTDLGTSGYISGDDRRKDVPPAVLRDYTWRATAFRRVSRSALSAAYPGGGW